MVKKKAVPEWLNSPLWSSDPPQLARSQLADDDNNSNSPPPPVQRPVNRSSPPASPHPRGESSSDAAATAPARSPVDEFSLRAQLAAELTKKFINMSEVRRLTCQGIVDGAAIRPTVWKLLLGYLPKVRASWAQELEKKRSQYKALKDEIMINPSEITRRMDESAVLRKEELKYTGRSFPLRSEVTRSDHPLSLEKNSLWKQFFEDMEMKEQIDRDIKRTHPDLDFFSGLSAFSKYNQEAMKCILFIFAKLNPGIRYVQGMNEILAPLFYVFRNDPDDKNAAFAEADTFFCFVELLSGFRDNFVKQLDNSNVGIRSTISKLSQLLKKHDEELWRHMETTTKVNPQLYAFRWITLLLTREFSFSDIFYIWDALFSDPEGHQETLLRICCGMLILVRKHLLAGDFTSNLKLLQNYPPTNITHLLNLADRLRGPLTD